MRMADMLTVLVRACSAVPGNFSRSIHGQSMCIVPAGSTRQQGCGCTRLGKQSSGLNKTLHSQGYLCERQPLIHLNGCLAELKSGTWSEEGRTKHDRVLHLDQAQTGHQRPGDLQGLRPQPRCKAYLRPACRPGPPGWDLPGL